MSEGYKVVQPMEILETHRKVLDAGGYHLRSAGVFKNGARFWSMAEGQGELTLKGEDRVKSYLFMASAVDGSSSTYAIGTNVRMVCWNKAPQVMLDGKNTARFIRVTHSQLFDADEARIQIQSNDEIFKLWSEDARELSETRLKVDDALMYFTDVFAVGKDEEDVQDKLEAGLDNKRVKLCLELFCGAGKGAELDSANGTLWGAYNAVTEFVDHHSGSLSVENRFASAMAGNGHRIKTTAWNAARNIVTGRRM
jgi:phage/plasmid-like protein (TIGR03299 family)